MPSFPCWKMRSSIGILFTDKRVVPLSNVCHILFVSALFLSLFLFHVDTQRLRVLISLLLTDFFLSFLFSKMCVHSAPSLCLPDMALGSACLGVEDGFRHLLNHVWPNIFETSAHVINAVFEAIEGLRVALGSTVILQYCLQGLFHPARRVRNVYWKIYNAMYIATQVC